jgi:hypothetical protein
MSRRYKREWKAENFYKTTWRKTHTILHRKWMKWLENWKMKTSKIHFHNQLHGNANMFKKFSWISHLVLCLFPTQKEKKRKIIKLFTDSFIISETLKLWVSWDRVGRRNENENKGKAEILNIKSTGKNQAFFH